MVTTTNYYWLAECFFVFSSQPVIVSSRKDHALYCPFIINGFSRWIACRFKPCPSSFSEGLNLHYSDPPIENPLIKMKEQFVKDGNSLRPGRRDNILTFHIHPLTTNGS